ncbi:hypothetical protein TNCT_328191 [Trichonephila clavata]|uniref:Uncharacterized protein n=1 Tax=Trichonephila clavata TaxID=2740835 RepID=A0A8X6IYG5_TRICU|nr:hypothetical protein TNCT_328191 [Trichonephila clavata]
MSEFLPCPIALCTHNYKFKAVKRPAEPILRPAKLTAGINNKNSKAKNTDFSFPKKTAKPVPVENKIRYGLGSASILDYALFKNINWPCTIDSIPELSSDPNPIKLYFPRTSKFEFPPPTPT